MSNTIEMLRGSVKDYPDEIVPQVIIEIRKGTASVIRKPRGLEVVILDYDVADVNDGIPALETFTTDEYLEPHWTLDIDSIHHLQDFNALNY